MLLFLVGSFFVCACFVLIVFQISVTISWYCFIFCVVMGNLKASENGGYKPTTEDLKKIQRNPYKIKLSGDWVFHTVQGEGIWAGQHTTFIRLHMCNLTCSWCDAWYTWKRDTKEFYEEPFDLTIDELYDRVKSEQRKWWVNCHNITITWWEPLLQQRRLASFIGKWFENHPKGIVQFETNGTIPLKEDELKDSRVWFNCSPKIHNSWNNVKVAYQINVLKQLLETWRAIFKFVVKTPEDIAEVLQKYDFIPNERIWFMPEGVYIEEHRKVFDLCIDAMISSWCNIAIRGQSIMRDAAKRGV